VSATGKYEVCAEAYSIDECVKECKDAEKAKINAPTKPTADDHMISVSTGWANCNGENVLGITAIMPLLPVVYAWLGSEFPRCPTDYMYGSAQSAQTRAVQCMAAPGGGCGGQGELQRSETG
jgi:hypothetical protein